MLWQWVREKMGEQKGVKRTQVSKQFCREGEKRNGIGAGGGREVEISCFVWF